MATHSLPDYRWSPLQNPRSSTRLFTLLAGFPGVPIRCNLFEVDLEVEQCYTALSYEWGPRTHGIAMRIDDGVYYIQQNLNAALLQLRSTLRPGQTLTLWVDAICIDQASTDEKNHQVRMMGNIFSQAEKVIAWLGEGNGRISRLFERLEGSSLRRTLESQSTKDSSSIYKSAIHEFGSTSPYSGEICALCSSEETRGDLLALAAASYWHRSWIVQEVVLAREVSILCGTARVSNIGVVALFQVVCWVWENNPSALREMVCLSMVLLNRMRFQSAEDDPQEWMTLGQLIQHHGFSDAHNPRDKVYAFVGMAQGLTRDFTVDYNKGLHQITMEIIRDVVLLKARLFDDYFRIIVAVFKSEHEKRETFAECVEWTERFHRDCQETLPPCLLSSQLRLQFCFAGRVASVAGRRVAIVDIPDDDGLEIAACDHATACDHDAGGQVEPHDIVFRFRSTRLCSVYRVTDNGVRFVAMLVVVAHLSSTNTAEAGNAEHAQAVYARSELCEGLSKSTEVMDPLLSFVRSRDLTDATTDPRFTEDAPMMAFISVADFLVIVEADLPEFLEYYNADRLNIRVR